MLKWVAVFTAFIANGPAIEIVDEDGPHRFATVEQCQAHLQKSVDPMNRILSAYTGSLDVMLLGECLREDVDAAPALPAN